MYSSSTPPNAMLPASFIDAYSQSMIPATFTSSASFSSSSVSSSSSSSATPHLAAAPYFSHAYMYGVAQDTQPIRRSLLVQNEEYQQQQHNNNPLLQSAHIARAVDIQHRSINQSGGWYQPHEVQQQQHKNGLMLDGFGSTMPMATYQPVPSPQKELMPRFESLFVSVPRSFVLPSLPEYLEATSFSCVATPTFEMKSIWNQVRTNLDDEDGCFVAEEKPYALTCAKSCSLSCTEFNVRCYSGHYASNESKNTTSPSGSWMTVEFQRRSGCCLGVMQTFRRIMRHVSTLVHVESKISMEEVVPTPGEELQQEEGVDMSDLDLNALAMPTLSRSSTNMDSSMQMCAMSGDSSLYDSLLDMISSNSTETQIQGMNALALCLDGTHPQSSVLLCEVARKLEGADCLRVREAAAKVVAQASKLPSAASVVVQHCLPLVLRSLMHGGASKCDESAAPMDAAFDTETKKHLLRSCVTLSSSVPNALDAEGSAVASSKLRRELLRMSASGDDEVKGLAVKAMNAIIV